jgi:pyruvate-formate lyase
MPAPRKQSPNSPETDRHQPSGRATTRAEALRWWRAGYQAGHQAAEHEQQATARWDRLVASYRTQHAADQQAKTNALLLELIDVLARLLGSHDNGQT